MIEDYFRELKRSEIMGFEFKEGRYTWKLRNTEHRCFLVKFKSGTGVTAEMKVDAKWSRVEGIETLSDLRHMLLQEFITNVMVPAGKGRKK